MEIKMLKRPVCALYVIYDAIFLIVLTVLTGCADLSPVPQKPVIGARARIRIDDGLPINVYPSTICYKSRDKEDGEPYTYPRAYQVAGRNVHDPESISLGMPRTSATPKISNEYYVEANKPTMISVSYGSYISGYMGSPSVSQSCGPVYVGFVPGEGKDYELVGVMKKLGPLYGTYCGVEINEIVRNDSGTPVFRPVLPRPALPCSETDNNQ